MSSYRYTYISGMYQGGMDAVGCVIFIISPTRRHGMVEE